MKYKQSISNLIGRNDYDINKLKEKTRHNEPYKLTYTVITLYLQNQLIGLKILGDINKASFSSNKHGEVFLVHLMELFEIISKY